MLRSSSPEEPPSHECRRGANKPAPVGSFDDSVIAEPMRLAQSLEELLIFVKAEKADTVVADPPSRGSAYSERARHDKSHTL